MTASSISRVLGEAGFRKSERVPGRIVSTRSCGYEVTTAGKGADGGLIIRVDYIFATLDRDAKEEIRTDFLQRYKRAIEKRRYKVRLIESEVFGSFLSVTA